MKLVPATSCSLHLLPRPANGPSANPAGSNFREPQRAASSAFVTDLPLIWLRSERLHTPRIPEKREPVPDQDCRNTDAAGRARAALGAAHRHGGRVRAGHTWVVMTPRSTSTKDGDEIGGRDHPRAAQSTRGYSTCAMPQHTARSNIHSGTSRQRSASRAVSVHRKIRAHPLSTTHARRRVDRTMGARDKRLPVLRSGGSYVVEL